MFVSTAELDVHVYACLYTFLMISYHILYKYHIYSDFRKFPNLQLGFFLRHTCGPQEHEPEADVRAHVHQEHPGTTEDLQEKKKAQQEKSNKVGSQGGLIYCSQLYYYCSSYTCCGFELK